MNLLGWLVAFVLIPSSVVAQQAATIAAGGTPIALDDGRQIRVPEVVGMDGLRLCGITARLKAYVGIAIDRKLIASADEPSGPIQAAAKRARREGDLSQAEKFTQVARDLSADQDEDAFKGALRKLAKRRDA